MLQNYLATLTFPIVIVILTHNVIPGGDPESIKRCMSD